MGFKHSEFQRFTYSVKLPSELLVEHFRGKNDSDSSSAFICYGFTGMLHSGLNKISLPREKELHLNPLPQSCQRSNDEI